MYTPKTLLALAVLLSSSIQAQTTLTFQPNATQGKDAIIASCIPCGYATTNFGNDERYTAVAWTNQGANSDAKSLLDFDLTSIPTGSTIISAELSLYFNPNDSDGQHSSLTNSNTSYIRRITSTWDELSVTWNNQPTFTTVNQLILPQSTTSTQDYPNINVTNLVQDMINDPVGSFGFLLEGVSDQEYYRLTFASSDHPNSELHPKLVVTYAPSDLNTDEMNAIVFQIYPNPSSALISIAANRKVETVVITNTIGEIVLDQLNPENDIRIDHLDAGTYFVKIITADGIGLKSLIID